jgi:hypothetical protein
VDAFHCWLIDLPSFAAATTGIMDAVVALSQELTAMKFDPSFFLLLLKTFFTWRKCGAEMRI